LELGALRKEGKGVTEMSKGSVSRQLSLLTVVGEVERGFETGRIGREVSFLKAASFGLQATGPSAHLHRQL
jgi:hypothetical protein